MINSFKKEKKKPKNKGEPGFSLKKKKKNSQRKQHESKCLRAWERILGMFSS